MQDGTTNAIVFNDRPDRCYVGVPEPGSDIIRQAIEMIAATRKAVKELYFVPMFGGNGLPSFSDWLKLTRSARSHEALCEYYNYVEDNYDDDRINAIWADAPCSSMFRCYIIRCEGIAGRHFTYSVPEQLRQSIALQVDGECYVSKQVFRADELRDQWLRLYGMMREYTVEHLRYAIHRYDEQVFREGEYPAYAIPIGVAVKQPNHIVRFATQAPALTLRGLDLSSIAPSLKFTRLQTDTQFLTEED